MKRFKLGVLMTSLFLLALNDCLAENRTSYAGISFGNGESNIRTSKIWFPESCGDCRLDDDFDALSLFFGYQWNDYLSAEIGYVDFESVFTSVNQAQLPSRIAEQESYGIYLIEKLNYPLSERFSVFGKFGAIFWNSEISISGADDGPVPNSDSDVELTYGFGVSLQLLENTRVSLEWNQFNKVGDSSIAQVSEDKIETVNVDLRTLSVGLSYDFDLIRR